MRVLRLHPGQTLELGAVDGMPLVSLTVREVRRTGRVTLVVDAPPEVASRIVRPLRPPPFEPLPPSCPDRADCGEDDIPF